MSLQATFLAQKMGVAQLIHTLFGAKFTEAATILERELCEQIRYDHREVPTTDLDAQWRDLPPIASLIGRGSAADLETFKTASYAFRLMTFAQCRVLMPESSIPVLTTILNDVGLGIKEVDGYAQDFVR